MSANNALSDLVYAFENYVCINYLFFDKKATSNVVSKRI